MQQMCRFLEEHVQPSYLRALILSYLQSTNRDDWRKIAFAGEYETCMSCPRKHLNEALFGHAKVDIAHTGRAHDFIRSECF